MTWYGKTINEAIWLMRNTVPVPGERAAAVESWRNLLADLGLDDKQQREEVERARKIWADYPWRHTDGGQVRE